MEALMAQTKSLYSVHPGVPMTRKWVSTLREKTGRSLDEWLAVVKESGPQTEKEKPEWQAALPFERAQRIVVDRSFALRAIG